MEYNRTSGIYDILIEYILSLREQSSHKDWGHIRGLTTIHSYIKYSRNRDDFQGLEMYLVQGYETKDIFIKMLLEWYHGHFERRYLEKYRFGDCYLYNFLYAISSKRTHKHDYYFKFSECIDTVGLHYLLISYQQNTHYLFTNIALASYYFHINRLEFSYKFYVNALRVEPNNPYILASISLLYNAMGGLENNIKSEKIMKRVVDILPSSPWANAWYGEALNVLGKYREALLFFEKYEYLTEGQHRTFEPFMRKAEAYIGLGDFYKARQALNKEKLYYFGEGYRFIYNELNEKLTKLGF